MKNLRPIRNFALAKYGTRVEVSASLDNGYAKPENLIDGDLTTRWCAPVVASPEKPVSVKLDLGEVREIRAIILDDSRDQNPPIDFLVSSSLDDKNYFPFAQGIGNLESRVILPTCPAPGHSEQAYGEPRAVRYIKYEIYREGGGSPSMHDAWPSLYEFMVCEVIPPWNLSGVEDIKDILLTLPGPTKVNELYPSEKRELIRLDGVWQFQLDIDRIGELKRWFAPGRKFDGRIQVPGCWEAQGYGVPTGGLRHVHTGYGWYKRMVKISPTWDGMFCFLKVGGSKVFAKAWVNGIQVGEHYGTETGYTFDITSAIRPGQENDITVMIDSRYPSPVSAYGLDELVVEQEGVSPYPLGGFTRSVEMEARCPVYLEDIFIHSNIDKKQLILDSRIRVRSCEFFGRNVTSQIEIQPIHGGPSFQQVFPVRLKSEDFVERFEINMDHMHLWSPDNPFLYLATLTLTEGNNIFDLQHVRFGIQKIHVELDRLFLNNRAFIARGGGSCHLDVARGWPLPDREYHQAILQEIKRFGHNYCRYAIRCPWPEVLDAADEIGILIQGGSKLFGSDYSPSRWANQEHLTEEWQRSILQSRNHPSMALHAVSNETKDTGHSPFHREMYNLGRQLNPGTLFIDTDGLGEVVANRPTDIQFCGWGQIIPEPANELGLPVWCHELGCLTSMVDIEDTDRCSENSVYLLNRQRALRDMWEKNGLQHHLDQMRQAAAKLYTTTAKYLVEKARLCDYIVGYTLWPSLNPSPLSDEGFINTLTGRARPYFDSTEWRLFNQNSILIANLELRNFYAGTKTLIPIWASYYDKNECSNAQLSWKLADSSGHILAEEKQHVSVKAHQVCFLDNLKVNIPEMTSAQKLTLWTRLELSNNEVENCWDLWAFPRIPLLAHGKQVACRGPYMALSPEFVLATPTGNYEILVTENLFLSDLEFLVEGGTVVAFVSRGRILSPHPLHRWCMDGLAPRATPEELKHIWFNHKFFNACFPSPERAGSVGRIILPSTLLEGFPHEGFCDWQFKPMIERSKGRIDMGKLAREIHPIIWECGQTLGLLYEMRVGKGMLVLSCLGNMIEGEFYDPGTEFYVKCILANTIDERLRPDQEVEPSRLRAILEK